MEDRGTLVLLAYILILVPGMIVGFVFARRKMFEPYHKFTMTAITLLNWVLIGYVMINTYSALSPRELQRPNFLIPSIHLVTGGIAQILATYLVIRMWFEKQLPAALKVKNIKRYMRFTLAMWFITVALGVTIYFVLRAPSAASAEDTLPPVATEEATSEAAEENDAATPDATEAADEAAPAPTEETEEDAPSATEATSEQEQPAATEEAPVATEDAG